MGPCAAAHSAVQDVKFGSSNMPAMSFIGGGATNYQQWFDFLGTVKDKRHATGFGVWGLGF